MPEIFGKYNEKTSCSLTYCTQKNKLERVKITEGGGPPVLSKEKGRRAVFFDRKYTALFFT